MAPHNSYRLLFLILFLLVDPAVYAQKINFKPCDFLETILKEDDLNKLLDLDKADKNLHSIRIVDFTGKFKKCEGFYISEKNGKAVYISYFIIKNIKANFNTGLYRDFLITKFKRSNHGSIEIELYAAYFECFAGSNPNYHLILEYIIEKDGSFKFLKKTMVEWDDVRIPDYKK